MDKAGITVAPGRLIERDSDMGMRGRAECTPTDARSTDRAHELALP